MNCYEILPSVTFMRLDGSTDPRDRQSIVRKFNEDLNRCIIVDYKSWWVRS